MHRKWKQMRVVERRGKYLSKKIPLCVSGQEKFKDCICREEKRGRLSFTLFLFSAGLNKRGCCFRFGKIHLSFWRVYRLIGQTGNGDLLVQFKSNRPVYGLQIVVKMVFVIHL